MTLNSHLGWHQQSVDDVLSALRSNSEYGLTTADAENRLRSHGRNELVERGQRSAAAILLEQFRGPMILMLVIAAVVSIILGEVVESIAILTIVVLNALLGFYQDYRSEQAMAALKKLSVPTVRVRRDGQVQNLSAVVVVPGDLVLLETGSTVPADARLLKSAGLQTQEAALTGESNPVLKQVASLEEKDLPVADRSNMVYLGTAVTTGHGLAVVTETGMATELGRIAESLQTVREGPTPLQRRLGQLGRSLALVALGVVTVVFLAGIILGESPELMLLTALSLAVAIVPEGLPAVATVALALGARRMVKRHALIRKLPAVETLGSVTVICSDKTGTLTENRMVVEIMDVAGDRRLINDKSQVACSNGTGLSLLLAAGTLCNDGVMQVDQEPPTARGLGDPTELAILEAAVQCDFPKSELDQAFPRVAELPFDSDRKRMTTIHTQRLSPADEGKWQESLIAVLPLAVGDHLVCTKGAVDAVVQRSAYVWDGEVPVPLDESWHQRIVTAEDELTQQGMRVLGLGFRLIDEKPENDVAEVEQDLIFIGMMAMNDPPRPEVQESVRRCREAGIRPVMITGDHPRTALSIARQLGIETDSRCLTSQDLNSQSTNPDISKTGVFARVSPHDKLKIVKSLQRAGEIVAMTGDGVNDAPALKQADIGVAMGRMGTDVAKEAADMVLLDDNFATIVSAVEEGRVVFDNIRKFVKYTMTSNAGELGVMLFGPLLGLPLPLLPLQILWVNLVTDGLPGLALAVEPAEPGTMQRPPVPPEQRIFDSEMISSIIWIGSLMAALSLLPGWLLWVDATAETAQWRTMVFTVLTIAQMGNALATRSARCSLFQIGLFTNKSLLLAVLLTLSLQLAVIYMPPLQVVFRTVSLSPADLGLCFLLGSVVLISVELQKLWRHQHVTSQAT
ncbi:MAG: cation-translocating P-type ATPase [Planctomycetaceae bacterium]|nr:cation-translocating P-type ATPase [Planctomycetaceae bacterium]